jgi:hypothetical protein
MTEPSPGRGAPLPRHARLMMRLSRRDLPRCAVRSAGLAIRAADGVATHRPIGTTGRAARSPRCWCARRTARLPWDHLFGGLVAERGFTS